MANLGPALTRRLRHIRDHDVLDVDIFAHGEPIDIRPARFADSPQDGEHRAATIAALKDMAATAQRPILQQLASQADDAGFADARSPRHALTGVISRRWINNSVAARLRSDTLLALAESDAITHIETAHYADIAELLDETDWATSRATLAAHAATTAWSVEHIGAPHLWATGFTGRAITCAVIDTGINYLHPDLSDRMWDTDPAYPNHGYNFRDHNTNTLDDNGHGTSCAGIVAGTGYLGLRTGVAPGAQLMSLKVGGVERNYWDALEFAIDNGAEVISMSMSWKYPSSPNYPGWRRACESVLMARVLHANSIGNQGNDLMIYPVPYNIATPGNCPPPWLHTNQVIQGGRSSAISCGATDSGDRLAHYSGRGPAAWEGKVFADYPYLGGEEQGLIKPDVCAPGPGTRSCYWRFSEMESTRPYSSFGGTSAATPHVAGALCLLAQASRDSGVVINPEHVQEALEMTAVPVMGQASPKESHYGAGRIDVYAAYVYGKQANYWN